MKITLDLPEREYTGDNGRDTDGAPIGFPDCEQCGDELYGTVVKLTPIGWLHAGECVEKALADPKTAWANIARHVAKYPSRHSAATIRAVITNLVEGPR
ncbi:hypothetical protein [Streptomyces bottropensis]|uniref:hypothetical protein n=1 Tax=Streptomyces bottropensis TaxID=42235 RepID=UPI0036B63000